MVTLALFTVCLGAGEIYFRLFSRPSYLVVPPAKKMDPYGTNPFVVSFRPYLYFHIPHARYVQSHPAYEVEYRINSHGFRGPDFSVSPTDGVSRLLVLGDSMAEGQGSPYASTFVAKLDERFRRYGWEALNTGVQGASPAYYALNMPRYLNLHPDAVLIVLYDNDLFEDRVREQQYWQLPIMDDPQILLSRGVPSPDARVGPAPRLITAVRNRWLARFWLSPSTEVERLILHNRHARELDSRELEKQARFDRLSRYLVAPSRFHKEWDLSRAYLDHMLDVLRRKHVRVVVAVLALRNLYTGRPPAFHRHARQFRDSVARWAGNRGVPCVDLVAAVETYLEQHGKTDLTIPQDWHPSAWGHEWIAGQIASILTQELIINN